MQFPSDTIPTPNIRTTASESYLKGHPLQNEQSGVLLHHTAFMEPNLTGVVNHLTNPANEASSHVVIGYDGARKVLATPDKVTFHAGSSMWNNRTNVNDFMVGIEFQGDTNVRDLTDA
jgi:N-acetyl-anhydromuramyl-L-alanine amidase AmpD